VRLFVAVRPPEGVLDAIASLPRPAIDGTRWTTRDQWHVTLRFYGEVDDPEVIVDALRPVTLPHATVSLGPRAAMLGRGVVQLPAHGLDDVAACIRAATATIGAPDPHRRFRGHLTLARTKGRVDLRALALACEWQAGEVELLRSHLGRGGARYETLHRFTSGGV
jgi:2'-5' RNA ligase